jgi:hypothetical protein
MKEEDNNVTLVSMNLNSKKNAGFKNCTGGIL